jgi:uncharacterized protein (DUF488 family)
VVPIHAQQRSRRAVNAFSPAFQRPRGTMRGMDTHGTLWTIGHSTRTWEVFAGMLHEARIAALVDVRRFAGSRRHPQFSGATMAVALPGAGIDYVPMPELGGRRTPSKESRNTRWRNASFRAYADYMETPEYASARDALAALASASRIAVMCAEAMWWQCHRGLISDDFKVRGWEVLHLLAPGRVDVHPFTSAAQVIDGKLSYAEPLSGALF